MNRTCLLGIAVALMLCFGNANAGVMTFGAKAGVVLSNVSNIPDEWVDTSFKTGFTGGIFLNFALAENFSLQPELLYSQKGVESNLYDGLVLVDATASFDYIEVPLLAMYTFSGTGNLKPYVYAGPGLAYILSSDLEISAFIFSTSIDISDLIHTADFFLVTGGGFDFGLGAGKFIVDARFQYGFTNVLETGDLEIGGFTTSINVDDFKNYAFILMVGYGF